MKKNFYLILLTLLFIPLVQGQDINNYYLIETATTNYIGVRDLTDSSLLRTITSPQTTRTTINKVEGIHIYFYNFGTAGNRYLYKYDLLNGEQIANFSLNNYVGTMGRDILIKDNYLYYSAGHTLIKLNKNNLTLEDEKDLGVGIRLDTIKEKNGFIYGGGLGDSGHPYRSRLIKIDINNLNVTNTLNVLSNPEQLDIDDEHIYLYTGGHIDNPNTRWRLWKINLYDFTVNKSVYLGGPMNALLEYQDKIFMSYYELQKGNIWLYNKSDLNLVSLKGGTTFARYGTGLYKNINFENPIFFAGTRFYNIDNNSDLLYEINGTNTSINFALIKKIQELSGVNSDFEDPGTYQNTFIGGFFNLGAKENFSVNLTDYFFNLDEWFILGYNGEELYDVGDKFEYKLPKGRKINGVPLSEEKTIFSIEKDSEESFIIRTEEHELLGFGLYGSAFGVPFYNDLGQRIGTSYYNIGVQVIGGINRAEKPVLIIAQQNRDDAEYVYYIDLFKEYSANGVSNLVAKDNILIANISLFFSNPYQNLFESFVKGWVFPNSTGLSLNNFECKNFSSVTNAICEHENVYFKLSLNRMTGVLRIEDKGTLELIDSNYNFKVLTYRPTLYAGINFVEFSDPFLDVGFIQTSSYKASTPLPPTPPKNVFEEFSTTTKLMIALLSIFLMTMLFFGIGYMNDNLKLYGFMGVFLGVGLAIFFSLIGFIPLWVIITMFVLSALTFAVLITRGVSSGG